MKIDILGGKWTPCACGDPFATHFAFDGGIAIEPLCFKCLRVFLYNSQEECYEEFTSLDPS